MAVSSSMFIFEVVVDSVHSYVASRFFVIRSDFADIFSLELKDPKQMHIVIPEPPPLPPAPPGKGKKAKPKPKGKKGKKGAVVEEPKEPEIQSGQSVLFTSNANFLIQSMKKCPLQMSLWSKEEQFVYIGSASIPWDPVFVTYLERVAKTETPPPVFVKDEYNMFQEGTAKLMAKVGLQVKLTHLGEKCTTAFRTLSEDSSIKKCLYTGINNKEMSYICTLKTTDEEFEANHNKNSNTFTVIDKQTENKKDTKIAYASYTNAKGADLGLFKEGDYCCMAHADKPPDSKYKAPETCPDIDFIIDYVRKTIISCNDNMRMLTPRPTITPRIKATDIDRLCYCKETAWPPGEVAERFKKAAQSEPCPLCIKSEGNIKGNRPGAFDIANIRGPCGKPECRIARDMRAYIENLVEEDNQTFDISEVIGPCGSKSCTLAEKIQEFLRHEGVFSEGRTLEGLSTQCACIDTMKDALAERSSCQTICSKECDGSSSSCSSESHICSGKGCPFASQKNYKVFYFTVEYDFNKSSGSSTAGTDDSTKYKNCASDCPSVKASENKITCSKTSCSVPGDSDSEFVDDSKCTMPTCPSKLVMPPSPADSDVVIAMKDIHNLCCVKTCEVADKVKEFITDAMTSKKNVTNPDDPCYCDCVCKFDFTKNTTYCATCGGYECMGDDLKDQPDFIKPLPCPIYHKTYDKRFIETINLPSSNKEEKQETASIKNSKVSRSMSKTIQAGLKRSTLFRASDKKDEKKQEQAKKVKPAKVVKKRASYADGDKQKKEAKVENQVQVKVKYPYPPVPKNMGWNWTAEDTPGLKFRPLWKPGAVNKILLRRYRALREGMDVIAKKKRALMNKKKKIEFRPTLVVTKKNGEYTVQMEVFKKYSKERLQFQFPYEEKPPLIYSIGKTEEEKMVIRKQRERRERRETRKKSRLLQSTFRDTCQEICLKAYNQAIGLLPLPNVNDPDCPCATASLPHSSPPIDSCSCSEADSISSSDTDNDEWTIEFSPPAAKYDPKAKHPPVLVDDETDYSYLDYKVKVLDKSGNQVPRFFKGTDGKQECSDLGGFWGPNHVWLEINKDGYIGPDERWVPNNFTGPDGIIYSSDDGFFTDSNGKSYKIGIDGYIGKDDKWVTCTRKSDPKPFKVINQNKPNTGQSKDYPIKHQDKKPAVVATATAAKVDKKTTAKPVKENTPVSKTLEKGKKFTVMRAFLNSNHQRNYFNTSQLPITERLKIDAKKIAKYNEVIKGLQIYENFYDLRPLIKTNRATQNNVLRKKTSSLVMSKNLAVARSLSSCMTNKNSTSCAQMNDSSTSQNKDLP